MQLDDLLVKYGDTTAHRQKAIFNLLFLAANRLQALFDRTIPEVTLKQFMLLTLVKQTESGQTFAQLGRLLGCSRQNVQKLAEALRKKGFVAFRPGARDPRALLVCPTQRAADYFQNDFSPYEAQLRELFAPCSEEEIAALFALLAKLCAGIDWLEQAAELQDVQKKTEGNPAR